MTQTYPTPIPSDVPANALYARPRYGTPGDWVGGVTGSDPGRPMSTAPINPSTANLAVAGASGAANVADYTPRSQNARLLAGQGQGNDIGRPRGSIAPLDPYPKTGDTPAAAPVVSSISPNTAVHGAQPIVVTITGTGFTAWSRVITGGSGSPWDASAQFISPTSMTVVVDPRASSVGTVSVAVEDHSVLSNVDKLFTIT